MGDAFLGRLGWSNIPIARFIADPSVNEAIASAAGLAVIFGAVGLLLVLTRYRLWLPMWRDWLTSVDHKKIGIMYLVLAAVMLLRGVIEGALMRSQQAAGLDGGFLEPNHFAQLFSTHGTIMIFFVAMPLMFGLINFVVPLQIGARDMAFPVMNQVSLGLTASAAVLIMISLVVGQFGTGGWTNYPPYTGKVFSPGEGPDYWIWIILLSGVGTLLTGINVAVTIYKLRAPGMTFMRMPLFSWTALCASIMVIFALPPVTVSTLMLALDRYLDFHFFTNDLGGNMMNYANILWMFGHPEVYIIVLPAYGVFSEIASTFSAKRLYGYTSLVIATMSISVISFTVWLHHFFTMGQSATVSAAFGIATMIIAVPTGIKVYDWMATLFRGRVRFTVPMIYLIGFFYLFIVGGLTGIILANPTIDFQVHNSLFLVAHFHNVLIPGTLFGMFAGIHYWYPKMFGYRLDETLGRRAAVLWIVGFSLTFMPLYWVGLMGMPRRSATYSDPSFVPWMLIAFVGACTVLLAVATMAWMFWASYRRRATLAVPVGDPWDGRTLEWAMAAPPPEWNFAVEPQVETRDAFADPQDKIRVYQPAAQYDDIEMPKNTPMGIIICVASGVFGFAMVWWIWWLACVSLLAIVATMIARGFRSDLSRTVTAAELEASDRAWFDEVARTRPVTRDEETSSSNRGLAAPDEVKP